MILGSTMLEVAIGMIFVFLLVSLLCSALNELISSLFQFRAKDLERGIKRLLSNPEVAQGFFNHPLIKPLYEGRKPSYIPARTFSLAVWNMATKAAGMQGEEAGSGGSTIAGVTKDLKLLRQTVTAPDSPLPDDLKQALATLMDEAGDDFDQARENVERWYDDAMDRVSGAFKRRTHYILLGLGLAAAVAMNVDSVNIATALSNNDDVRKAVAGVAENYAKSPLPGSTADPDPKKQFEASAERINLIRGQLNSLGLPIGWSGVPITNDPRGVPWGRGANGLEIMWGALGLKLLGFIITALAVSQGAPFWFDLLNKFIVIRSTVKPREKSPERKSKDTTESDEREEEEAKDSDNKT